MQEEQNKLFVSNLSYSVDDDMLLSIFTDIEGIEVVEAKVIVDKFNNGRSKGFGFVTLATAEMAEAAIAATNGKEIEGRQIFVNIARPQEKRTDRNDRSSFGGNGGGQRRSFR